MSCAARHLNAVDVQCRLGAILDPYLRYHVGQMNREALLLEALQPSVSRIIWDNVINCNEISLLLLTLSERQESKKAGKDWIPHPAEIGGPIKTVLTIFCYLSNFLLQIDQEMFKNSQRIAKKKFWRIPQQIRRFQRISPKKLKRIFQNF